jgi:tRNA A-37 threonylcarbamoyl transferase component Bud32
LAGDSEPPGGCPEWVNHLASRGSHRAYLAGEEPVQGDPGGPGLRPTAETGSVYADIIVGMRCRLVWVTFLMAPTLLGQQYPFIPVANSPKNIEHILEDRQGRLWISTHDDVLCFDGARFLSLHELGLPTGSHAVSEDLEGGILAATGNGVYRFFRGRLEHVFSDVIVEEAIGVAPGVLLAATDVPTRADPNPGLYRIQAVNGAWKAERFGNFQVGGYLSRDPAGNILAVCPGGWCEVPAKVVVDWNPQLPIKPTFHRSALRVQRVARDRAGCIWFRSVEGGSYQCAGDAEPVRLPAAVAGRSRWAAEEVDASGSLLFANAASLATGRPGSFQIVTPANGLPAVVVTCAVRARDGSIWVGSIGGLYRFAYPFRMQYWKSQHGLNWSFARAGGRMLAGTSSGVAYLSEDGEWKVLKGSSEFGTVSSVLTDPKSDIYAAVAGEGVIELSPDGNLAARTPVGEGGQAAKLVRTGDGTIWLSGARIYRVLKTGGVLSLVPEKLPDDRPSDAHIALDRFTGDLWACYAGGLIRKEPGGWRQIAGSPYLPDRACISLDLQANGDAWLGYAGLRASVLVHPGAGNGATVQQFRTATSFFLGLDTRGWVWRGSGDGISVADPAQVAADVWLHLNEIDELTDVDANRDSFFSDTDGSVWWAADASIVHFFPPSDLIHPTDPPPVFPSAFSVNGGRPILAETFHELPNGKKLTAHIGSLQFERRDALRVRYRLLPQQEWHESKTLDLDLGTPSWGMHTLEIQSRFSLGQWSQTLRRSFGVLRPWWFSWQAILGFAGIGLGGAASNAAWRRKRRARASASLPDLTDWRVAALSPESQWLGTTLDGRYEVLDLVARGGFASVLKGRDLRRAGRWCAIKIFRHEAIDEQWLTHRFQQEVSALEQILHPSVVSIYGHGLTPAGAPYLVMEFIEGGTLRDLLKAGPLTLKHSASLLRQAAVALEQIHARSIYHRDLKPENFMIRRGSPAGSELVLIDFSIAIVKEPDQTIHGLSRAAGTIYYMAPEQAIGFATPASDVYSLAKILLEMLTGQRLSTLLPNASLDLPDRVRELVRGLPIPLSGQSVDLLGSALEFDPSRRPQSAMLFAEPIVRDLSPAKHGLSSDDSLPEDAIPGASQGEGPRIS